MLKVKRVYESTEASDGARFLVERLWPRGMKKEKLNMEAWLKDVAPSDSLRRWFGHDPFKWKEFQERYQAELDDHPDAWGPILEAMKRGDVTLLYSTHDTEHNNAVALKAYLEALEDVMICSRPACSELHPVRSAVDDRTPAIDECSLDHDRPGGAARLLLAGRPDDSAFVGGRGSRHLQIGLRNRAHGLRQQLGQQHCRFAGHDEGRSRGRHRLQRRHSRGATASRHGSGTGV